MSSALFVQVIVGGLPYSVAVSDIEKFPGSFFACMIKKEWTNAENKPIVINRDGALFKYVYSFLVNSFIPRDQYGQIALDDDTLEELKQEADFFGLKALSKECKTVTKMKKDDVDLHAYMTIRKYLRHLDRYGKSGLMIDYSSHLIDSLKAAWSPFCLTGRLYSYSPPMIYKNSSVNDLKIDELIAGASQSPFGRGTETLTDKTVRNSFEIPASKLNKSALLDISRSIQRVTSALAPHMMLELRPYKLVIYQEGGHFDAHRDTVRGEGHIGTVVVILNSEYTGGELEVSHNQQTVAVTGAYKWVAMYGDCLHKINPVTSGTRVSLIYDIYGTPRAPTIPAEESEEEYYSEDEEDKDEAAFWERQNCDRVAPPQDGLRDIDEGKKLIINAAVNCELTYSDVLIITLQHLYPECQTSSAFLKGGDRALYDLLSEQFDVQVVAATILRSHDEQYSGLNCTNWELFSPAIVKRVLGMKGEDDDTEDADVTAVKKQRVGPNRIKLVISNQFDEAGLLDYSPYIAHTGNESQAEETVYIVAALQVVKRVV